MFPSAHRLRAHRQQALLAQARGDHSPRAVAMERLDHRRQRVGFLPGAADLFYDHNKSHLFSRRHSHPAARRLCPASNQHTPQRPRAEDRRVRFCHHRRLRKGATHSRQAARHGQGTNRCHPAAQSRPGRASAIQWTAGPGDTRRAQPSALAAAHAAGRHATRCRGEQPATWRWPRLWPGLLAGYDGWNK